MAKQKKLVDTKQYCIYLTEPSVVDKESDYKTHTAERFYICALNAEPCIARYLEDSTQDHDVCSYTKPKIDKEKLKECQLCNIPKDLVKQIMVTKINAEKEEKIANLEKRLKHLE